MTTSPVTPKKKISFDRCLRTYSYKFVLAVGVRAILPIAVNYLAYASHLYKKRLHLTTTPKESPADQYTGVTFRRTGIYSTLGSIEAPLSQRRSVVVFYCLPRGFLLEPPTSIAGRVGLD